MYARIILCSIKNRKHLLTYLLTYSLLTYKWTSSNTTEVYSGYRRRCVRSRIQFNSIKFMFLKFWMSPQGPPREYIKLKGEMRKWLSEKIRFLSLAESRQRRFRCNVYRQTIPDARTGHRESSSANCWQFKRWHHQAVSASRAKTLSTRQIGDTNNRSEILRCDPMKNLER